MPTAGDIAEFLNSQALGRTTLPKDADLSGKTILVTGANTGLGLDTCKHLARMNVACLILGCRSLKKGEAAKQSIYTETDCESRTTIEVWEVDLDHYASVIAFTERARASLVRLDAVVANAGIELKDFETSEGFERTLLINILSTFLLCLGVLPKLSETSQIFAVDTKLTLVGSLIHYFGPDKQLHAVPDNQSIFEALSNPTTANMESRYPLSKLIEHLCFNNFCKHYHGGDVTINLVNPGWCGTELSRNKEAGFVERFMFRLMGRTSEQGSRTLVHAVCAGKETHGKYLSECEEKRQSTYVSSDAGRSMSERLWKELFELIQRVDRPTAQAFL